MVYLSIYILYSPGWPSLNPSVSSLLLPVLSALFLVHEFVAGLIFLNFLHLTYFPNFFFLLFNEFSVIPSFPLLMLVLNCHNPPPHPLPLLVSARLKLFCQALQRESERGEGLYFTLTRHERNSGIA